MARLNVQKSKLHALLFDNIEGQYRNPIDAASSKPAVASFHVIGLGCLMQLLSCNDT